jgi:phage terminase large subunit
LAEIEVRFPPKLEFLFQSHRYKVAHGGRGSGKSWGFARALLIQGAQTKLRILCTREVQKSIKDSVHKLLSDQIQNLGLGGFYTVLQTEIRGANGTEFIFAGLSDQTAESIKSYEGVDRCWVEEGQAVSKRSWDILIPTIRKDGSEIWVSFNPELDTDETWKRFVVSPPPGAFVAQVNYTDNPWFGGVLEQERLHSQATDPKEYQNIWEGKPRAAVAGAIYADEIIAIQEQGRICPVPYDPKLKVFPVWDLGWNDAMSIGLFQRHLSQLRCIKYLEGSHKTLDDWSAELKDLKMNWGTLFLPHDGDHGDFKTGLSAAQILRNLGWDVTVIPQAPVEHGIKLARSVLRQTYFDRDGTPRLVECLKRYKRAIPTTTGEPAKPVHDEYSHGADMFRYAAHVVEQMTNDDWGKPLNYKVPNIA